MNKQEIENIKRFYPIQKGEKNPILRKISEPIKEINEDLLEFAEILNILMFEYDGIGLAAPQIGRNIRMISIVVLEKKGKKYDVKESKVLMNPEIIYKSDKILEDNEGCVSLPGIRGDVCRSHEVKVKYLDFDGQYKTIKAKGLNATLIQHEIDHLDGILFIDKAQNLKTQIKKLIK